MIHVIIYELSKLWARVAVSRVANYLTLVRKVLTVSLQRLQACNPKLIQVKLKCTTNVQCCTNAQCEDMLN